MTYKIVNDDVRNPLRFIAEDGTIYGQFYNSRDKRYHLAEYVPCKEMPKEPLCKCLMPHFPASRNDDPDRRVCAECYTQLVLLCGSKKATSEEKLKLDKTS